MKNVLLAILFVLLFSVSADACNSCGLFGRQCRFSASSHSHHAVEHIDKHYDRSADVYIINSLNYPAPLVGGGTTSYRSASYQDAASILLDPNLYFSQEQQLIQAAQDANALRTEKSLALFQRVAELQAPVAEKLATGQAAKMILEASGLSQNQTSQESGLIINRDSYGRLIISRLSQSQIEQLNTHVAEKVEKPTEPAPGGKYPLLTQYCSKCHGVSLAQPKASLYLGDDANVAKAMRAKFFDIESAVKDTKKMPPAESPQPTDAERDGIIREIRAVIVANATE